MRIKLQAPTVYLIMVGGSAFFSRIIFTMYMLFQVEDAALTALQLVLVGTVLEATGFFFEIPTGVVADAISRRLSIIIGTALTGIAFIIQAIPLFPAILFGTFLLGIGGTFLSGAGSAWIYDEAGEARATALFLQATQLRQLMGIIGLVASIALGLIAPAVALLVGGGGFLFLALFLTITMPEENFHPKPREERDTWRGMVEITRRGIRLIRSETTLLSIFGIVLFTGLYSEAYDRLWAKYLIDLGLSGLPLPVWFGLMGFVGNVLGLIAASIARRMQANSRERIVRSLWWLYLGMTVMLLLVATGFSFWFVLITMWAFDTLRDVTFPLQQTWLNQRITDSSVRATVISMNAQTNALGQMVGGPPLGLVGERIGIRVALTLSALLLLPVVGILGRLRRYGQNEQLQADG